MATLLSEPLKFGSSGNTASSVLYLRDQAHYKFWTFCFTLSLFYGFSHSILCFSVVIDSFLHCPYTLQHSVVVTVIEKEEGKVVTVIRAEALRLLDSEWELNHLRNIQQKALK